MEIGEDVAMAAADLGMGYDEVAAYFATNPDYTEGRDFKWLSPDTPKTTALETIARRMARKFSEVIEVTAEKLAEQGRDSVMLTFNGEITDEFYGCLKLDLEYDLPQAFYDALASDITQKVRDGDASVAGYPLIFNHVGVAITPRAIHRSTPPKWAEDWVQV
tara:strand:- start:316 stop:801 length:486 start_codon:yes stop_codon:yes gene_type:complete